MTAVLSRTAAAWLRGALALITVLAAAAAFGAALDAEPSAWLVPAAMPAVAGIAAAALARSLGAHMVRPLLAGLVVATGAWCLQWWPATLVLGLFPGPETLTAVADTAEALRETIWTETIPVPATDPVLAGLGALLALVALLTDALAAGLRSPALAGLPALALVAGGAAVTASVAPWPALVLAAAAWLGLLALDERPPGRPAPGARSPAGTVVAGIAAVAVLAVAVTQLPLLSTGLAPEGRRFVLGQGAGPVNPAADLGRELRSDTGYAGISYRTQDGRGVYLRTAVVDDVYASPWGVVPPEYSGAPTNTGFLPAGVRLAGGPEELVARSEAGEEPWTVVEVSLEDWAGNWVPLPDQVWALDEVVGEWGWQVDRMTSAAYRLEVTPVDVDYRAAVVPLEVELAELAGITAPGAPQDVYDEWGAGPELEGSRVQALAGDLTDGLQNPVEQATAIQEYLTSARFTYSETAPVDLGYDGSGIEMTEQFLEAAAGYCIHYASAMTMMAQAVGIPARVVVGYAPVGTDGDEHRVTSDAAHSWPELYLGGVGWVPFEPTPGVGRTPTYAQPGDGAEQPTEDPGITTPEPAPTPDAASPEPVPQEPAPGEADGGAGTGRTVAAVAAGVLAVAVLAGLAALPRWVRSRRRRARLGEPAGTDARAHVAGAWRELEDTAVDLGLGRQPHESEPVFTQRLLRHVDASEETGAATPETGVGTAGAGVGAAGAAVVGAITWARYAPPSAPAPAAVATAARDTSALIAELERTAAPASRRRARWLPASLLPASLLPKRP